MQELGGSVESGALPGAAHESPADLDAAMLGSDVAEACRAGDGAGGAIDNGERQRHTVFRLDDAVSDQAVDDRAGLQGSGNQRVIPVPTVRAARPTA